MLRTKDGQDNLVELTGETGAALLDDVTAAVDDLAAQGIVAKDAEPVSEESNVAAVATETVDLDAMKQTIDRMKQQTPAAEDTGPDQAAEIVKLREDLDAVRSELAALRADQQLIASKDADSATTLAARIALMDDHNAKSDAVVAGLFDLVLGVSIGTKEVVIERDGNGSVHDPEGKQLAQQMAQMAQKGNGVIKAGEYAGATLFGGN